MKTEHDWRDVLLKAASIVEEGWCQGVLHLDKEGVCIYNREDAAQSCATGAIARASDQLSGEPSLSAAYDLGSAAGRGLREYLSSSIPNWNDRWDQTADKVAEAMRQAATKGDDDGLA